MIRGHVVVELLFVHGDKIEQTVTSGVVAVTNCYHATHVFILYFWLQEKAISTWR